jgi:DNA-binding transcriptional LysR family regulator
MIDFRLKVFYTVAKRLNFTKAAAELFISQPAVTKHIKELEQEFKISLFERSGNKKISLTSAGELLLQYAEQIFGIYRELEYDMNLLAKQHKGVLRIGASSTVAQYIIPPVLAQFHQKFKDIQIQLVTGNTADIEQGLIDKQIDFGIIEGISRNPQIKYEQYLKDDLVLVCSGHNYDMKKETIKPNELKDYPLLLREPGSGTLDVITRALRSHHIKLGDLTIEMQLGGTKALNPT